MYVERERVEAPLDSIFPDSDELSDQNLHGTSLPGKVGDSSLNNSTFSNRNQECVWSPFQKLFGNTLTAV